MCGWQNEEPRRGTNENFKPLSRPFYPLLFLTQCNVFVVQQPGCLFFLCCRAGPNNFLRAEDGTLKAETCGLFTLIAITVLILTGHIIPTFQIWLLLSPNETLHLKCFKDPCATQNSHLYIGFDIRCICFVRFFHIHKRCTSKCT